MALDDINFGGGLSGTFADLQNFVLEETSSVFLSAKDILYPTPTYYNGFVIELPSKIYLNNIYDILTASDTNSKELLVTELTLIGGGGEVNYAFIS